MTHWVKKLGIASAFALALGFSLPGEASASPSFCRSGAGHPVHGRSWCLDKGFGLGRSYVRHDDSWRYPRTRYRYDNDRYRYDNDRYRTYDRWRPSWSYTPGYDWRYNNSVRTRRYDAPSYRNGWADRYRFGSSSHRHDRACRH